MLGSKIRIRWLDSPIVGGEKWHERAMVELSKNVEEWLSRVVEEKQLTVW